MNNMNLNKLKVNVIEEPNQILKHLHKGISIPIIYDFHKYILNDMKAYNAKALILEEPLENNTLVKSDNITGLTLVYSDGSDTLFFGFFGVYDHHPEKIKFLLKNLIDYGIKNNYKRIRGPINVPTMIFGWGFMVEGSSKDIFIGSPINPPIYQNLFIEKGFKVLFQEDRYDMPALKMDPHRNPKLIELGINNENYKENPLNTGDYPYEFINPGKEGMYECFDEYLQLNIDHMPPSARITPKSEQNLNNLIDFIFTYGADWMMWFVRQKDTKKMVANGYVIPDIFSRNRKGELDSISFHAWIVHPDHRRNYISMLMYGMTSLQAKDKKTPHYIKKGSWPVGADNIPNSNAAKKMGGKKDRSHLILQIDL